MTIRTKQMNTLGERQLTSLGEDIFHCTLNQIFGWCVCMGAHWKKGYPRKIQWLDSIHSFQNTSFCSKTAFASSKHYNYKSEVPDFKHIQTTPCHFLKMSISPIPISSGTKFIIYSQNPKEICFWNLLT